MSMHASFEHNENERDLNGSKLNKARSPAVAAPLKGTKNFMSASSKVTAASPRRRILTEWNDGTRGGHRFSCDFGYPKYLESYIQESGEQWDHASLKFDKLASKFRDLSISYVARFQMLNASIIVPREELGSYLYNTTATEVEVKNLTVNKLEQEEEHRLVPDSTDVQTERSQAS